MENLKKIRKIVIWLGVLFALNLVVILFMIPKFTLWTLTAIVVQIVIAIYFIGISLTLIKELENKDDQKQQR